MIQIEESNPSFESCSDCIHSDDSEETCILRRCIHAVAQLKECYVPKQRKKGKWKQVRVNGFTPGGNCLSVCSECGWEFGTHMIYPDYNFCPNCGADMTEGKE